MFQPDCLDQSCADAVDCEDYWNLELDDYDDGDDDEDGRQSDGVWPEKVYVISDSIDNVRLLMESWSTPPMGYYKQAVAGYCACKLTMADVCT